jgi:hypothetical protein
MDEIPWIKSHDSRYHEVYFVKIIAAEKTIL